MAAQDWGTVLFNDESLLNNDHSEKEALKFVYRPQNQRYNYIIIKIDTRLSENVTVRNVSFFTLKFTFCNTSFLKRVLGSLFSFCVDKDQKMFTLIFTEIILVYYAKNRI